MRALFYDGTTATVRDCPDPIAPDGWALIRVDLAGICATDLEIVRGYMGFRGVMGHEFVGTVHQGPQAWLGQRVVAEINFACETCSTCLSGHPRHCPHRTVMGIAGAGGALAQWVAAPVRNLHRVPEGMPDDVAVFTEPVAAAFEILEQVEVSAGSEAVVLGDGRLGLLVAQVLHHAGARVTCVGKHPDKLTMLRGMGIQTCLRQDWGEGRVDLVVDATGSAEGIALALKATRPRGTLVLKSTVAEPSNLHFAPAVVDEITIIGSRCGPFAPALKALHSGAVDVRRLIGARLPLQQAAEALQLAARPGMLKVVVEVS